MNENVTKMARIMGGCKDRTCEDCLHLSKKLFSENECALIGYAEVLNKAGYRKQSDEEEYMFREQKRKTYGDIFEEFIQKVDCKKEIGDYDYRPCIPLFGYPEIPNAIIIWLKDGSTIIYQTDTAEVE